MANRDETTEWAAKAAAASKAGDAIGFERAFSRLYDLFGGRLYGFVYSRTKIHTGADDVCQKVWFSVAKNVKNFEVKAGASFSSWAFTIAKNAIFDESKMKSNQPRRSLDEIDQSQMAVGGENGMDVHSQRLTAMKDCLERIDPSRRETIQRHFLEGMTYDEIARIMDVASGTVASRIARGLADLRPCMEARERS